MKQSATAAAAQRLSLHRDAAHISTAHPDGFLCLCCPAFA